MSDAAPSPAASTRRRGAVVDAAVVVGLLVLASVPRLGDVDALGLTHYDEGVYAETAAAVVSGAGLAGFHPQQHLHAPPLHPILGGLVARIFDVPPSRALLALSLAFGAATAPLLYLVVRAAVGRAGGVAAGLLLAGDGAHVLWSGAAMTDASFTFWFVAALGAWARAERRGAVTAAALCGLAVGAAWSTKYHGVLALVVGGLAAAPTAFADRGARKGIVVRLCVAAAVAASVVLPWRLATERLAGGSEVVAAQLGRFLEPAHWLRSLATQAGYLGLCEAPLVVAVAGATALGGLALLASGRARSFAAADPGVRASLVSVVLFALLTPCYHPYPRLALPWLASAAAVAGVVVARVAALAVPAGASRGRRRVAACVGIAAATTFAGATAAGATVGVADLRASHELGRAALAAARLVPPGAKLAVLAEPPVNVALSEAGISAARLGHPSQLADAFPGADEVWAISGYYVRRNGEWESFERAGLATVERRGSVDATVGAVRRCDDFLPPDVRGPEAGAPGTYGLDVRRVVFKPR